MRRRNWAWERRRSCPTGCIPTTRAIVSSPIFCSSAFSPWHSRYAACRSTAAPASHGDPHGHSVGWKGVQAELVSRGGGVARRPSFSRLRQANGGQAGDARIVGAFSSDSGRHWDKPETIIDTPLADGDPAVILAPDEIQVYSTTRPTGWTTRLLRDVEIHSEIQR